jgi:hypothetical protein
MKHLCRLQLEHLRPPRLRRQLLLREERRDRRSRPRRSRHGQVHLNPGRPLASVTLVHKVSALQ